MNFISLRRLIVLLLMAGPLFYSSCGNFNAFPESSDVSLGQEASQEFESGMAGGQVLDSAKNPQAYQYLHKVVDNILASGQVEHKDDFAWRVRIIDSEIQNAICLPGGFIYVYSGLIKYLDSEDQLAGVLAHEIAHADLRHGTSQMTKQYGIGLLITIATGGNPGVLTEVVGSLVGLSFSRHDESEADEKSVDYLYATKYDPRGTARFFEKMLKEGDDYGMPQFISTHPSSENRVRQINQYWEEKGSKTGETYVKEYREFQALFKHGKRKSRFNRPHDADPISGSDTSALADTSQDE